MTRFIPPPHPCLLLLAGLVGCNELSLQEKGDDSATVPNEAVDDYLRIDIYPSDQNPDLLPETHFLDAVWEGISIPMTGTATLSGTVLGYDATPCFDVSVPGDTVPVKARVTLSRPETIMAASVTSDPALEGAFALSLPRSNGYVFSVVPLEPALLPFHVEQGFGLPEDQSDLTVDLGFGAPVYGQVFDQTGAAVQGSEMSVRLRDPEVGTEGTALAVGDVGSFHLRAEPGRSYEVVLAGSVGDLVPTLSQTVLVEDEAGARVDFHLGSLDPIEVSGRVLSQEGAVAVSGATVRFTAIELQDHQGASLVLDDVTSSRGEYRVALLAGRYTVEYIAPSSLGLSPLQDEIDLLPGDPIQDLDQVLPGLTTVSSRVLGPDGEALEGVSVVATEEGFDHYTYAATTDEKGWFDLAVPAVDLLFALTPPAGDAAVTFVDVATGEFPAIIMLDEGDAISGVVVHKEAGVAYALIEVRNSRDQLYATTLTDEGGSFAVRVHWDGTREATRAPDARGGSGR